jgi:excisionase family DNA binding protein
MTTKESSAVVDADEDIMLAPAAAKMLILNLKTLYKLCDEGKIPHVRIGPRRLRFRRSSLVAWLDRQETGSPKRRAG